MNDSWSFVFGFFIFAIILGSTIGYCDSYLDSRILEEEGIVGIAEMAGVSPSDIELVEMGNNKFLFGQPQRVQFVVLIDSTRQVWTCESQTFSPMICRDY